MTTTQREAAKRPASALAGPYGHPFHPILVTVPIGAWVMSFVFDLASRWTGDPAAFSTGAFWLIAGGIVGALLAAVFGFLDLMVIPRGTKAFMTGLVHMALNLAVVGVFVVGLVMRRGTVGEAVGLGPLAASAIALLLLAVSGWLGGKLTYRFGVRVADEETQSEGY